MPRLRQPELCMEASGVREARTTELEGARMSRRTWNPDSVDRARCQHPHCTDCATRRGSKRGIRRMRHTVKRILRGGGEPV